MLLDSTLLFDNAVAITVTRDSTNVLDMGAARDMGIGQDTLSLLLVTDGLFAAAGAGTLTVAFAGSSDNATYVNYSQSIAFSIAQLNASNLLLPIYLPPRPSTSSVNVPRYYKLIYTVATGPFTAGVVTAGLVLNLQQALAYPSGYTTTYV